MSESDAMEKSEAEAQKVQQQFMEQLDVDEDVALILVQEGFSSVDEVAYVPTNELLAVDEFDEEIVDELRQRARDYLLTQAIANEEVLGGSEPADDLMALEGMDENMAIQLAGHGICTQEDLAEQSVDELIEEIDIDKDRAGALILAARAPWFEKEEGEAEA
jgi:N utilization substance protein A